MVHNARGVAARLLGHLIEREKAGLSSSRVRFAFLQSRNLGESLRVTVVVIPSSWGPWYPGSGSILMISISSGTVPSPSTSIRMKMFLALFNRLKISSSSEGKLTRPKYTKHFVSRFSRSLALSTAKQRIRQIEHIFEQPDLNCAKKLVPGC